MKEDKGALVAEPLMDGPAAKAGILSGDVITALNDQPVNDIATLPSRSATWLRVARQNSRFGARAKRRPSR